MSVAPEDRRGPKAGGDTVALVREIIDAVNSRDWDAALSRLAPEYEYDLTRTESPLRGTYSRAQMRRVMEEFLGTWERVRYEPHEFLEDGGRVIVPFTTRFRGRDGIEMQSDAVWVWEVRDALVTRLVLFQSREEALTNAGQ